MCNKDKYWVRLQSHNQENEQDAEPEAQLQEPHRAAPILLEIDCMGTAMADDTLAVCRAYSTNPVGRVVLANPLACLDLAPHLKETGSDVFAASVANGHGSRFKITAVTWQEPVPDSSSI